MKRFMAAVAELIRSLAGIPDLPPRTMRALDEVRKAMVEFGGNDPGPPP